MVSANAARVARIETGGGLIEMDSEQMFVLLLPWKSEFDFYDAEGNPVTAGGHVWKKARLQAVDSILGLIFDL